MFEFLVEEEHPVCLKAKINEVFKSHQSATVKGILLDVALLYKYNYTNLKLASRYQMHYTTGL